MEKKLYEKVIKAMENLGIPGVDQETAEIVRDLCHITKGTRLVKTVVKNRFVWFYNGVKSDLERHHGVECEPAYLAWLVAREEQRRWQRGDTIVGVYEVSDSINEYCLSEAVYYVDGMRNKLQFRAYPSKYWTEQFSWRLKSGLLPNRINGYTAHRLHQVFDGYKIRIRRKKWENQFLIIGIE